MEQAMAEKIHFVIKGGLKITWKGLTILRKVATSYLDLITDGILLYTILNVITCFTQSLSTFSDQVAVILLVSIIVPLVTSGITIAFRWPLVVLSTNQWRFLKVSENKFLTVTVKILLGLFIFICSPLIPAMITLSNEQAKDERKALIQKRKNTLEQASVLEEFEALTKYINETRLALLTGKRNELCLELVFQLSIHLSMVFLSRTKYPVENGLQTIFNDNDINDKNTSLFLEVTGVQEKITKIQEKYNTAVVFLIFSLVWSFKTAAMTAIKIKAETKTFLPFKSKLLLGWRYLTVYMTRIGCIVAGIGTIIGVLGMMNHYHAENVPLNLEIWNKYNPSSKLELCILTVAWKLWRLINCKKFVQTSSLFFRPFQMLCCNKKLFDFYD
jgi:hypothetical protein